MATKYIRLTMPEDADLSARIRVAGVRDMAKRFGVSPSLISMFASGKCKVREEVAQRIIARANLVKGL